jgi:hypothetical protein
LRGLLRYAAFIMRLSVTAITETSIISCNKACSAALIDRCKSSQALRPTRWS